MSLLTEMMFDCVMLNKSVVDDTYGAQTTQWSEGAHFKAAIKFDSSIEAKVAEKQGVTGLYTIGTFKDFSLDYHDVFKNLKDNKIFRVTSKGDYKVTPELSTLNLRLVSAEEWSLPNG